jgi:hypothetical protein
VKETPANAERLTSLAKQIRSIARDCFDLGTVQRLRELADRLERQANGHAIRVEREQRG